MPFEKWNTVETTIEIKVGWGYGGVKQNGKNGRNNNNNNNNNYDNLLAKLSSLS